MELFSQEILSSVSFKWAITLQLKINLKKENGGEENRTC